MTTNLDSLALGSPVFPSQELAALARNKGLLSAWRSLIKSEGNNSIRTVSGDFSVGFLDEAGRGFLAVNRFAIRSLCYRIVDGEYILRRGLTSWLIQLQWLILKPFSIISTFTSYHPHVPFSKTFLDCRQDILLYSKMVR